MVGLRHLGSRRLLGAVFAPHAAVSRVGVGVLAVTAAAVAAVGVAGGSKPSRVAPLNDPAFAILRRHETTGVRVHRVVIQDLVDKIYQIFFVDHHVARLVSRTVRRVVRSIADDAASSAVLWALLAVEPTPS